MSLANLIAFVSSVNADPSTQPEHNVEEPKVVTVVRNAPQSESKRAKASKSAAPIHNPNAGKSMTPGITLPERNTLDAKGFLLAMRNAGKRPNDKGLMVVHPNEVRNDQIKAIHAYCGYDNRGDFGSQDQAARAKAQRELRGEKFAGPSREEQRAASRSVAGFVAGMPKPQQRIVLDLQARAVSLTDAMLAAKTSEERAKYKGLLDQTNDALAQLGF